MSYWTDAERGMPIDPEERAEHEREMADAFDWGDDDDDPPDDYLADLGLPPL